MSNVSMIDGHIDETKFVDEEIIKALETHIELREKEICTPETPLELLKLILDLINRQKAELAKKDTDINILIRKKEALRDEIAELQRKNSELKIELKAMRGSANSYKAEVERLQSCNKMCVEAMGDQEIELATAKSEAIKEFADRLKKIIAWNFLFALCKQLCELIDNLVKEMTEGE